MAVAKPITQEEFNAIKQFQRNGVSINEVAKILGRSSSTIWYIYHAEDMADYQKTSQRRLATYRKDPPKVKEEMSDRDVLDFILSELKEVRKELKLVPKRRTW